MQAERLTRGLLNHRDAHPGADGTAGAEPGEGPDELTRPRGVGQGVVEALTRPASGRSTRTGNIQAKGPTRRAEAASRPEMATPISTGPPKARLSPHEQWR
jgi:hypothetical protein